MIRQTSDNSHSNNIIEAMNQAFGNHAFYGLEYVLDEWLEKTPSFEHQNKLDSLCFLDFRD